MAVPGFHPAVDEPHDIHLETQRLREFLPGLIGEPIVWNRTPEN